MEDGKQITTIATVMKPSNDVQGTPDARAHLLTLAQQLDDFGLQTQQFLCQQLDTLERAIAEFESEKAAWRRQFQRGSAQLASQREEMRLQFSPENAILNDGNSNSRNRRSTLEAQVRKSGVAPLRILLQPGRATSMQVGLLTFELSKLNRDMGGQGIRFEVDEVRVPRRRLLEWVASNESGSEILELTAYSILPLAARGHHVALDVDATDRLEDWIAYKSRLIQSSLVDHELVSIFAQGKTMKRGGKSHFGINEATRDASDVTAKRLSNADYHNSVFRASSSFDCIEQQLVRLENYCEQLRIDCGLRIQIELLTAP